MNIFESFLFAIKQKYTWLTLVIYAIASGFYIFSVGYSFSQTDSFTGYSPVPASPFMIVLGVVGVFYWVYNIFEPYLNNFLIGRAVITEKSQLDIVSENSFGSNVKGILKVLLFNASYTFIILSALIPVFCLLSFLITGIFASLTSPSAARTLPVLGLSTVFSVLFLIAISYLQILLFTSFVSAGNYHLAKTNHIGSVFRFVNIIAIVRKNFKKLLIASLVIFGISTVAFIFTTTIIALSFFLVVPGIFAAAAANYSYGYAGSMDGFGFYNSLLSNSTGLLSVGIFFAIFFSLFLSIAVNRILMNTFMVYIFSIYKESEATETAPLEISSTN